MQIVHDRFTVGQSATARCMSDILATRMEWLSGGVVINNSSSTQRLDLVFSLVNDSIHNQSYTCRVSREDGEQAEQTFVVIINGEA